MNDLPSRRRRRRARATAAAALACSVLAGPGGPGAEPAGAQTLRPAPAADFTFKRVRPPTDPLAKRLIFNAPAAPQVAAATDAPGGFWGRASPRLGAAEPARLGRLAVTEAAFLEAGWPARTDLAAALRILRDHGGALKAAAMRRGVSAALLLAVAVAESGGDPRAISPKGARGLMQLRPATAARFGVADAMQPAQAIEGAAAYLDWLLARFGQDALLALAGYNAGEGAVARHGGVPPYAETRAYVPRTLAAFAAIRGLCATPPATARDACAFAGARR